MDDVRGIACEVAAAQCPRNLLRDAFGIQFAGRHLVAAGLRVEMGDPTISRLSCDRSVRHRLLQRVTKLGERPSFGIESDLCVDRSEPARNSCRVSGLEHAGVDPVELGQDREPSPGPGHLQARSRGSEQCGESDRCQILRV